MPMSEQRKLPTNTPPGIPSYQGDGVRLILLCQRKNVWWLPLRAVPL